MINRITLDYDKFYILDFNQIVGSANGYMTILVSNYGVLLWVALIGFLIKIFLIYNKKNRLTWDLELKVDCFFLGWFVLFMIIQLPWIFVMGRYLPPALIGLVIFLANQIYFLIDFLINSKFINKKKSTFYLTSVGVVIFGFLFFFYINVKGYYDMYHLAISWNNNNTDMVRYLATSANKNSTIYVNTNQDGIEFVYEIGLHLSLLNNRSDLNVDFFDLSEAQTFKKNDVILSLSNNAYYDMDAFNESFESFINKEKTFQKWDNSKWDYYVFNKDLLYSVHNYEPKVLDRYINVNKNLGNDITNGLPLPSRDTFKEDIEGNISFKIKNLSLEGQPLVLFSQFQDNLFIEKISGLYIENNKVVFKQIENDVMVEFPSTQLLWDGESYNFEVKFGLNGLNVNRNGVVIIQTNYPVYINMVEPIFFYDNPFEVTYKQLEERNIIYKKYNYN